MTSMKFLDTRISRRVVFRTDNYEGSLYKRSPYFVGSKLWDALPQDIIDLPDIFAFRTRVKRMYSQYVDLLA